MPSQVATVAGGAASAVAGTMAVMRIDAAIAPRWMAMRFGWAGD
jgi:hypothetical protein